MSVVGAPSVDVVDLSIGLVGTDVEIVDEIALTVRAGEVLGLVGESGSGKTTVGMALLGHCRTGGQVWGGTVSIDGHDLAHLGAA
jgi:peptide/nickel transport system ATP-binding protein